jgi:hypothetical protein
MTVVVLVTLHLEAKFALFFHPRDEVMHRHVHTSTHNWRETNLFQLAWKLRKGV